MEEQKNTSREEEKRSSKVTLIVIIILLILILGVYFLLRYKMPDYMMSQGKKYYEIGNYDRAFHMFSRAADMKPYDNEPIYYQALTLSKMPPTYENQKKLYEIAQLEDCDEASSLAENILKEMRNQLVSQVGPNYADNILFEDELIRWNNSKPITYMIASYNTPEGYADTVKQAFLDWQTATNGEISFREVSQQPDINVTFVDALPEKGKYEPNKAGKTEYRLDKDTLKQMNIYIKKFDDKGQPYDINKLSTLALHEVGHALGLGGHSADPNDVMFHTGDVIDNSTYRKAISDRDLNTLKLLYRMVPNIIDAPISPADYKNLFYHEVITSYPDENYEEEIQRLLGELQNDRQNIITWVDLAINYAYKHQYARSNYILENVIPLVATDLPNQQVVLYNIAANYYKMKDYNHSSKFLNMAEHLKSDFDTQLLGTYLDVRQGRLDLAKAKLDTLLSKYPDNIDVALKLAEVYHIKKDDKMEKKVIEDFVKKNPKAEKDRRIQKYKAQKKTFLSLSDVK